MYVDKINCDIIIFSAAVVLKLGLSVPPPCVKSCARFPYNVPVSLCSFMHLFRFPRWACLPVLCQVGVPVRVQLFPFYFNVCFCLLCFVFSLTSLSHLPWLLPAITSTCSLLPYHLAPLWPLSESLCVPVFPSISVPTISVSIVPVFPCLSMCSQFRFPIV